jgi:hypothetical protein
MIAGGKLENGNLKRGKRNPRADREIGVPGKTQDGGVSRRYTCIGETDLRIGQYTSAERRGGYV